MQFDGGVIFLVLSFVCGGDCFSFFVLSFEIQFLVTFSERIVFRSSFRLRWGLFFVLRSSFRLQRGLFFVRH